MMRKLLLRALFWLAALLLLLAGLLLAARFDSGYMLVVYPPWRIELSFMLGLALILAAFFALYFSLSLIRMTLSLPGEVRAWRARWRQRRCEGEINRATAALIAGEYAHARKLAEQALARGAGSLAALIAANAALELGDSESVRRLLDQVDGSAIGEFSAGRQAIERRLANLPTSPPAA